MLDMTKINDIKKVLKLHKYSNNYYFQKHDNAVIIYNSFIVLNINKNLFDKLKKEKYNLLESNDKNFELEISSFVYDSKKINCLHDTKVSFENSRLFQDTETKKYFAFNNNIYNNLEKPCISVFTPIDSSQYKNSRFYNLVLYVCKGFYMTQNSLYTNHKNDIAEQLEEIIKGLK